MRILLTGCAGFIGFHTVKQLLELEYNVTGIDNLDKYSSLEKIIINSLICKKNNV